ncbi:MAG: ribonuclease P protein component [Woeseiaceae bacterium]
MAATSTFRFTRSNRLLDAAAFGRVFKTATRSRDQQFTVLCRANKLGGARLGLAVSKKHCRLATDRNRLKRIIRESFRQQQSALQGLDFVVMNRPRAERHTNAELFESLDNHWQRCVAKESGREKQE